MEPPLATANSIQPYKNATRSPKASRKKTYCPPEEGNIDPISAKAKAAHIEISAPITHTSRNSTGCGNGPAMSFAVRKIDDPMMPPASSSTESSSESPRTSEGCEGLVEVGSCETVESSMEFKKYVSTKAAFDC